MFGDQIAPLREFWTKLAALDCKPNVVQFEIDGLVYTSAKLPATLGWALWPRLTTLLGAGLVRIIATGDAEDLDERLVVAAVVAVAEKAVAGDVLLPVLHDLMSRMQVNVLAGDAKGGDVSRAFDAHFAGEYMHSLKVAAFAVAHNLRGPTLGVR